MSRINLVLGLIALPLATIGMAQPVPPPGQPPMGPPPAGMGPPPGMPAMPAIKDTAFKAACRIADGVYQASLSSPDAIKDAECSSNGLTRARISSGAADFNGLLVTGAASDAALRNGSIVLSGPGSNDFLGIGAGAMVVEGKLTVDRSMITTNGRVSSATVAAENATLIVRNSTLTANGGPLPAEYKPRIGPGMMEPPAPLGLKGTARTHLSMSNSKTYFYRSKIIADAWGALSTDATGGNLYLEANDSVITVRGNGYGVYSDFGAKVALNRTTVKSGGPLGIIAGEASIVLNKVTSTSDWAGVMIHSVMAFRLDELGTLAISGSRITSNGPVVLVKSANAAVTIDSSRLTGRDGTLFSFRVNEDPNATKTNGAAVPGNRVTVRDSILSGDIVHSDSDRASEIVLENSRLRGAATGVSLRLTGKSKWMATGDSRIVLLGSVDVESIDAPRGVTISATLGEGASLQAGNVRLASGGILDISK